MTATLSRHCDGPGGGGDSGGAARGRGRLRYARDVSEAARTRVSILAPFTLPSARGNAVTVDRIARGLGERGVAVDVWDLSRTPAGRIEAALAAEPPRLLHAFHALRAGPLAVRLARRTEAPLVVTLTGTDANHDLLDAERGATVRRVLEAAAVVTAFDVSIVDAVAEILPAVRSRMRIVPQSVRLPRDSVFDLAARWSLPADRVLFVLPAGIRAVKAPRSPLAAFDRLVATHRSVRLLYAGPVIDNAEADHLLAALRDRPWARYLGPVPHAAIPALLGQADVVLNSSISEGGMANSVLEALALGRAALVSDIPGNRALVEDGVTGLLYRDDATLEAQARRLVLDPALRARLGAAGRRRVESRYPPAAEIDGYLEVYRRLLPVGVA